jgi:hypothetical protein
MARDRAEHLAIVEDYKMREGHLRTVNKVALNYFTIFSLSLHNNNNIYLPLVFFISVDFEGRSA